MHFADDRIFHRIFLCFSDKTSHIAHLFIPCESAVRSFPENFPENFRKYTGFNDCRMTGNLLEYIIIFKKGEKL